MRVREDRDERERVVRLCETVGLNEGRSMRLNKAVRGASKAKRVASGESLRERKGGRR